MCNTMPRPVYAGIEIATNGNVFTRGFLMIFGRTISQSFSGPDHKKRAEAWVVKWEEFLIKSWADMALSPPVLNDGEATKQAAGQVMADFVASLREQGVVDRTIELALNRVGSHAS